MQGFVWMLWAYAIGSIPSAVWVSKLWFGTDVRQHGSGNAGATNMVRNFGWKAGLGVLLMDILKGFLAVQVPIWYFSKTPLPFWLSLLWAVGAALGHIWPIWAGFKGGKAVATLLGAMLALAPMWAGIAVLCFVILLWLTKYVSLSAMVSGGVFSLGLLVEKGVENPENYVVLGLPLLLMYTHRSNIQRLLKGNENTFTLKRKT